MPSPLNTDRQRGKENMSVVNKKEDWKQDLGEVNEAKTQCAYRTWKQTRQSDNERDIGSFRISGYAAGADR